mmetsp:Transcript_43778/g.128928  ORF Transcript_43778/g.128928 Transcript_43778/m.128928 type:complete len:297 (-) Transcript_43778:121-1011(-)
MAPPPGCVGNQPRLVEGQDWLGFLPVRDQLAPDLRRGAPRFLHRVDEGLWLDRARLGWRRAARRVPERLPQPYDPHDHGTAWVCCPPPALLPLRCAREAAVECRRHAVGPALCALRRILVRFEHEPRHIHGLGLRQVRVLRHREPFLSQARADRPLQQRRPSQHGHHRICADGGLAVWVGAALLQPRAAGSCETPKPQVRLVPPRDELPPPGFQATGVVLGGTRAAPPRGDHGLGAARAGGKELHPNHRGPPGVPGVSRTDDRSQALQASRGQRARRCRTAVAGRPVHRLHSDQDV